MKWICVKWNHTGNEPVVFYSEIDDDRREIRKVELFRDGHIGYADSSESFGSTHLGEKPIPLFEDIPTDEFEPREISKKSFEEVWSTRKKP